MGQKEKQEERGREEHGGERALALPVVGEARAVPLRPPCNIATKLK